MREMLVQARLAYRGMYYWTGPQGYVSNVVLRAPLTLAIYAFVARAALDSEQTQRSVIGMILYGVPTTVIGGITQMFSNDREAGVLPVSVVAAEHRSQLYALRALWHLPNAIVAVATGIAFSWLVLDLRLGDVSWPALVLCALAATLSVAAYALFAGNIALVLREYVAAMSLSSGLLLICSGVVIPSERLPRAIEWLANGLPLTHALRGFRAAFAGASLSTVASNAAWEVVVAAVFLVGGSALFARITDTARTTGSFELGEN
jgi:ABC-2 type transport system permease protein